MAKTVLSRLLEMGGAGSIAILFVLVLRLLLKRAPKIYAYALWAVVLARLLCPVSISSNMSLVPRLEGMVPTVQEERSPDFAASDPGRTEEPLVYETNDPAQYVSPVPQADPAASRVPARYDGWTIAFGVWLAGAAAMVLHALLSLWKLKVKLREAAWLQKNVYICDRIPGPFVIGVLRPRIYLPSTLTEAERGYILAHERHHIRRLDPLTRVLSYLALCLHWWNPLVWLAFALSGRDMEMSCDEAVVKALGPEIRADYAFSLLRLATGKNHFLASPLAFGEGDPKGRIHNLGKWKKPALWVSLGAAALCVILAVCLLTTQPEKSPFLYLRSSGTQGMTQTASYAFRNGSLGGTLTAEYWERGELISSSAPMAFTGEADLLQLSMELTQANWGDHELLVDMTAAIRGRSDVDASLRTSFPIQRTGAFLGWAFTLRRPEEKLEAAPGKEYILAAGYVDQGKGVEVPRPGSLERDPSLLEKQDHAVLLRVKFTEDSSGGVSLTAAVEKPEADAWTQFWFDGRPQGTLAVELWVDGACTDRQEVEFSAGARQVGLARYVFHERGGEVAYGTGIGLDFGDGISPKPDLYFPVPEGKGIETHAWNLREPGPIPPGQEVTLAAWYFDSGDGIKAYSCDALDGDPETARGVGYGILVKLNLSQERKYLYDYVGTAGEVMPLEKVLGLAQKGKDLTWEDLEGYAYLDVGFGRRIQRYETTGPFYLAVGSTGVGEPDMAILRTGDGTEFDLMAGADAEAFIQERLNAIAVQETENWLRLQYAGDTGDIEVLSIQPLGVDGSWEEGRMTVCAQSLWERFSPMSGREESRLENAAVIFSVSHGGAVTVEGSETAGLDEENFVLNTRRFFPEDLLERALALEQAAPALEEANQKKLEAARRTDARVEELLEEICAGPRAYSHYGAYIQAHPESYDALMALGPDLIDVCYRLWCRGDLREDFLEPYVLASAWAQVWAGAGGDAWLAGQAAVPESVTAFLRDFDRLASDGG